MPTKYGSYSYEIVNVFDSFLLSKSDNFSHLFIKNKETKAGFYKVLNNL
jgi:hypothetical protein